MADPTQLGMLRRSVKEWNAWREQHPTVEPDLRGADLEEANLEEANLNRANLSDAELFHADFSRASLIWANLSEATLLYADFTEANLVNAEMVNAYLVHTNFDRALLIGANLSGAHIGWTSLGDRDFRQIKGLETIIHKGPSYLSINSIYLSKGELPEEFVRGTGVPDTFLEYMRALTTRPIEYYSCFISYSSKDRPFAERLYADLQHNGVRCWFAPHNMRTGDEIRTRIDDSIRMYDKLLLILSHHAIASLWVKKEVETAFEKEEQHKKLVLFPVKLDETVMETQQAWAADIRRMRHIGDFTHWKDHDAYQQGLQRLLRDLKQEKA